MYKRLTILICFVISGIFLSFETSQAKTVTLTAVKDCVVRADMPDTAFHLDQTLTAYKTDISNQAYFYFQFELPSDCTSQNIEAESFTFQLTLDQMRMTAVRAGYLFALLQAAETAAGDLNGYTFNTAPGINPGTVPEYGTTPYLSTEARVVGYGLPTATEGGKWVYTPTGNYLTYFRDIILPQDNDGILTFFFLPRYVSSDGVGDLWASIEHPDLEAPQAVISYQSNGNGLSITLEQSDGDTIVYENGSDDSYTIVLDEVPEYDVAVNITAAPMLEVVPQVVVFSQDNWNQPQEVVVSAVDDEIDKVPNLHHGYISHLVTSSDVYYDAFELPDVLVSIYDDEGVCDSVDFRDEDLNQDCNIDIYDLMELASVWGQCTDPARQDICQ